MQVRSLRIQDLRILSDLSMRPGPGVNLVVGGNGAGKTSILEAIYLLGRGRSFRHEDAGPLIRHGSQEALIVAQIEGERKGDVKQLGVARAKGRLRCRLDGADIEKRSVLARTFPVLFIGSQPQRFLEAGPGVRRRFLDMGVFHVEHSYLSDMTEFQRVLRQRNMALRTGDARSAASWEPQLATLSETMTVKREALVERLEAGVRELMSNWAPELAVQLRYRRGWSGEGALIAVLAEKRRTDLQVGYTTRGPHRAEWELVNAEGVPIEKTFSRGQQKLLMFAFNLALHQVVHVETREAPVILIDDLSAEMDLQARDKVLTVIENRKMQAFITAIEAQQVPRHPVSGKMFHVEQGQLISP